MMIAFSCWRGRQQLQKTPVVILKQNNLCVIFVHFVFPFLPFQLPNVRKRGISEILYPTELADFRRMLIVANAIGQFVFMASFVILHSSISSTAHLPLKAFSNFFVLTMSYND
jgi:hypothetical protein